MEIPAKHIVLCGDSFVAGDGIPSPANTLEGLLKHAGYRVTNISRISATNMMISLQVDFAIKHLNPDVIFASSTSSDRINFVINADDNIPRLSIDKFNYENFKIFSTAWDKCPEVFHDYQPVYFGDSINTLSSHLESKPQISVYQQRYGAVPDRALREIMEYNLVHETNEMRMYVDGGLISSAYLKSLRKNIPIIIADRWNETIQNSVLTEHLVKLSWFDLAHEYPDSMGTLHTSEVGHKIMFDTTMEKINGIFEK